MLSHLSNALAILSSPPLPTMRIPTTHAFATLLLSAMASAPVLAQDRSSDRGPRDPNEWVEDCRRSGSHGWNDEDNFCEVRDSELPGSLRRLDVDASRNGGISIRSWDRNTILVRAKVRTQARSESAARRMASELRVRTEGGTISTSGPTAGERESWSVSYEIWVPRASNYTISAETYNGGVSLAGVGGTIRADTHNGGLSLSNLSGDVRARTHNGGVNVVLSGRQWSGAGLDVETRNGGVRLDMPESYNAQLEMGTTNGGMNVDFPVTVQGRLGRTLSTKVGSGGPTIRVMTTNGGVRVRRS